MPFTDEKNSSGSFSRCLFLAAPRLASTNSSVLGADLPSSLKEKAKVSGTAFQAVAYGIYLVGDSLLSEKDRVVIAPPGFRAEPVSPVVGSYSLHLSGPQFTFL